MVETVSGGDVEPGLTRLFQFFQPTLTGRAGLFHGLEYFVRVPVRGEFIIDVEFHRQFRQILQLIVGTEHGDVDARNHARHHLVGYLRKRLLAELEKYHIGAVAQHQEFEVVVPHLGIAFNGAVKGFAHVMVLGDADRFLDDLLVFKFRQ